MGSDRDHLHSLRLGEIEDFIQSAETFQLSRCDPAQKGRVSRRPRQSRAVVQRSAGRWPAGGRQGTDQGLDGRPVLTGHMDLGIASGRPELFCCAVAHPVRRIGGDEETRTPDPLLAKETLCQLSYVPEPGCVGGGRFWTRTRDLCLIRAVL